MVLDLKGASGWHEGPASKKKESKRSARSQKYKDRARIGLTTQLVSDVLFRTKIELKFTCIPMHNYSCCALV